MSFRAGDFNKYGKVYRLSASATKDAAGHIDEMNDANWELVGPRHFNIKPATTKEFILGDQLHINVTHLITTTYDKQSSVFSEKQKFVYNNRTFNFAGRGLNVDELNRWLSFPASEVAQ